MTGSLSSWKRTPHFPQKNLVAPEKSKSAENTKFARFWINLTSFWPILDVDGPILQVFHPILAEMPQIRGLKVQK